MRDVERDIRVVVLGLGLIGGSLARSLRERWSRLQHLTALDTDREGLAEARNQGVADAVYLLPPFPWRKFDQRATALTEEESVATAYDRYAFPDGAQQALAQADLVIVATPLDYIAPFLRILTQVTPALLTDMGSVKTTVLRDAGPCRLIGGHPMAGSERRSYRCSSASLFENAVYALCPSPQYVGGDLIEDMALLCDVVTTIGALPRYMEAPEHDRAVATISHLPHVIATTLVNTAAKENELLVQPQNALQDDSMPPSPHSVLDLAAGGFRDITRIASSDSGLWTGIVRGSRERLLPVINRFETELARFRKYLETDDVAGLQGLFAAAAHTRDELPQGGSGALATEARIHIELEDRPGEIAVVGTLLAVRGINIKNIGMVHARQYEGGRMQLFLSSNNQVEMALHILRKAGYECYV
ncbi:MAG TPA: prephenate dehydrogenase/arogenate dehydrogenase family protein [Clostridiaceae bacterium]|nr:prephenate dehydrogenase/arogenate dehydrogenase family protein [Clostridiaceae bacterium]